MKTIAISDLHLGMDDRISENVKNRPKLAAFIDKIGAEKMADELVIAGDFLDQWFYPGSVDLPRDSREFYLACAKNNQALVESTHEGDLVQTLKVVGDGKVNDIVPVENDHIRRAG